ncbi:MAG: thioredoxin family protein [Planctomycetaceae bacterium]|nr:thioredoxin family protein [Planctomycetaceae bacterium]
MEALNKLIAAVLVCGIGAAVATTILQGGTRQVEVNDSWFQQAVLQNSRPVVVKFGAEWCGPCRMMDASLDQLQSRYSQRAAFVRINVDEKPELFQACGSGSGIPQIMIFRNGEVIARQRGFAGDEGLNSWLAANLSN